MLLFPAFPNDSIFTLRRLRTRRSCTPEGIQFSQERALIRLSDLFGDAMRGLRFRIFFHSSKQQRSHVKPTLATQYYVVSLYPRLPPGRRATCLVIDTQSHGSGGFDQYRSV